MTLINPSGETAVASGSPRLTFHPGSALTPPLPGGVFALSDLAGAANGSFAEFIRHGHVGWHATRQDWVTHLGTIFPEARLKNVIELRSADTCSLALAAALVAFWKGLSYDGTALEAALERLAGYGAADVQTLYAKASVQGLAATCSRGQQVGQVAADLLALAQAGLARQGAAAPDLACLAPLTEAVERGLSPADQIIGQLRQGRLTLDRLAI